MIACAVVCVDGIMVITVLSFSSDPIGGKSIVANRVAIALFVIVC